VISHLSEDFHRCFRALPEAIQKKARKNYRLWVQDPFHPSLDFKKVHPYRPLYSVRVGLGWRALGILKEDVIVWFWIGPHGTYDKLLKQR